MSPAMHSEEPLPKKDSSGTRPVQADDIAKVAILMKSAPVDSSFESVTGLDWDNPKELTLPKLCNSFLHTGFQATQLGRAILEINKMLKWRPSEDEIKSGDMPPDARCKIWLSFTSNMISAGLRETFVFLAKHKLVDVIVTSAGGVEEDFVKCLAPTFVGEFSFKGAALRKDGWNRIGNLFVPNNNYCLFEDWLQPLLDECLEEQKSGKVALWTPSLLIDRLGERINDPRSLYYWCHKNNIPVFCPGLTDGSLGDNLYFHAYRNPGLIVDVVQDVKKVNDLSVWAKKSGMIILGGGIAKHHTCNAHMMRNGADFAVYVNTAQEFDGCDSGARPDEAVSWGKIKADATPVKVFADATIAFPLIVAATFAPVVHSQLEESEQMPPCKANDNGEAIDETANTKA